MTDNLDCMWLIFCYLAMTENSQLVAAELEDFKYKHNVLQNILISCCLSLSRGWTCFLFADAFSLSDNTLVVLYNLHFVCSCFWLWFSWPFLHPITVLHTTILIGSTFFFSTDCEGFKLREEFAKTCFETLLQFSLLTPSDFDPSLDNLGESFLRF